MADTLDILDYDEAYSAVGGKASDKALFEAYITGVSRMLDDRCGPVVRRTITDELHDGGQVSIWLRYSPVTSFTSVLEAQGPATVTCTLQTFGTEPAEGFHAEPHVTNSAPYSGRLVRLSGGDRHRWYSGFNNVKATYVAGRYANTAAVDERFKRAALICLRQLWRAEQIGVAQPVGDAGYVSPSAGFPGFALPNAVVELLRDELRTHGIA